MDASNSFPSLREVVVKITGTTTWTVPSGVYGIRTKQIGGGAGGGGGPSANAGGGSGFITESSFNVTPGEGLTINIGGGGGGQPLSGSGGAGGTTQVLRGGTVLASASGGDPANQQAPGRGGQNGEPAGSGGRGGNGLEGYGGFPAAPLTAVGTGYGSGGGGQNPSLGGSTTGGGIGGSAGTSGAVFIYYSQTI